MSFDGQKALVARLYDHIKSDLNQDSHKIPLACLFPDVDAEDEKELRDAIRCLTSINIELKDGHGFQVMGLVTKLEYSGDAEMFEIVLSRDAGRIFEYYLCGHEGRRDEG